MPFQFLNLRERADALRRAGVDWAMDFHDALDAVEDLADADAALEEIGDVIGMANPDASDTDAIKKAAEALVQERDAGVLEIKRLKRALEALQAEQGRLVAFMGARGIVPPPPPRVTRPAVPPRLPYRAPGPTLAERMRQNYVDDDDIPF